MDLKEENILREHIKDHWYYKSKAAALSKCLGSNRYASMLDIGAGSGFFSRYLLNKGSVTSVTCVDPNYSQEFSTKVNNRALEYRRTIEKSNAKLVLMMDVIEHVDNDSELVQKYSNMVPRGTTVVISVPAFNILWSKHDTFLGHKRRYTRRALIKTVEATGLKVTHASYYFGFLLPIVAVTRIWARYFATTEKSQLQVHHPIINKILHTICLLELPLFRFNYFAGLSVFCIATKE